MSESTAEGHAHHPNYFKIYLVLLVLLAISIVGPMFEIRIVTLITAFGIAGVKAYLVVKNFMHIDIAQRYISYLVATSLVFMLLFFAGVAPDVMRPEGANWKKPAWLAATPEVDITARPDLMHAHGEHGSDHGEGHGSGGH